MLKSICRACYEGRGYLWDETAECLWEGKNNQIPGIRGVCCCVVNDQYCGKSSQEEKLKRLYKSSRLCNLKNPPKECVMKLEHLIGSQK